MISRRSDIVLAISLVLIVVALLALTPWPTCNADAPRGARIGGIIMIGGCQ